MTLKPKNKHFSFRRFLGLRTDSTDTSSAVHRLSEDDSSRSSSRASTPSTARPEPSTVAETGRGDGVGIANINTPSPSSHPSNSPSFFANSSHFVVQNMKVVDASQHHAYNTSGEGWKLLLEKVAPAALHDSETRYDPPKCDEDTRVEVISELMSWITDTGVDPNSPSPQQRLLCMTGAAGSGKSALQQTIAERLCASEDPDILGATFFFSATDQTRNSVSALVPTIAYQLALRHRPLRQLVAAAVENDPLIFSKSLRTQMRTLIVNPVEGLGCQEGEGSSSSAPFLPRAILIDGLDECQDEDRQAELLLAIKECFIDTPTPFRLFLCSRPEWAIRSALKPGGYLHGVAYHIQLSDQYDATADIRRFLRRRILALIPQSDFEGSGPSWFSEDDLERLVEAASGQFVCAATVVRYLSERHASPAKRLNTLLTWISSGSGNSNNPFSTLDILYSKIVTSAKAAYEAALDHADSDDPANFLLLLRAYQLSPLYNPVFGVIPVQDWDMLLCGELNAHELVLSDLRSLITTIEVKKLSEFEDRLPASGFRPLALHIYHKSFVDFCGDQSRSKDLYIHHSRVIEYYAQCSVQHMSRCPLLDVRYIDSATWEPWKTGTTQSFHFCIGLLSTLRIPGPLGSSSLKLLLESDMLEKMGRWLHGVSKAERYFLERWVKFTSQMMDELKDTNPELFSRAQYYHDMWREEHRRLIHRRR